MGVKLTLSLSSCSGNTEDAIFYIYIQLHLGSVLQTPDLHTVVTFPYCQRVSGI